MNQENDAAIPNSVPPAPRPPTMRRKRSGEWNRNCMDPSSVSVEVLAELIPCNNASLRVWGRCEKKIGKLVVDVWGDGIDGRKNV